MNAKQIIATWLPCILAIALAACGGRIDVEITSATTDTPSAPAVQPVAQSLGALVISTQPTDQMVIEGATASFSVGASGADPFLYQWKKNGTEIAGATSSTYTTNTTTTADNGAQFSVTVTSTAGTVTSNPATLTVTATAVAPAITAQPTDQTVPAGQTATFSVAPVGTEQLTYQWKKNDTNIPDATSSSYTISATLADDGSQFSVVVSNGKGTASSNTARLAVTPAVVPSTLVPPTPVAPAITTQPTAQTIRAGETATFSVVASGMPTPTYQWRKSGIDINGATSSSYTTPAMSIAGSGVEYSVVISNSAGSVTSRSATLTVTSSSSAPSYGLVVNTSGGTHEITDCIQDSSTGLFWEGKTDSGARAASNAYTNYDSTVSAQKTDGSNPTQAEIDAETNSIGYVNYVNRIALCGFTDWRMPSIAEIKGIVDKSQLAEEAIKIDSTWFPHSQTLFVWTSTPDDYAANAIGFDFADGENGYYRSRYQPYPVRLVRGSQ